MATIYARLINHYIFKYQTVFSARLDKLDEDGQILNGDKLIMNLNFNQNLTESVTDNIDIKSSPRSQIQKEKMRDSGCRFD